MIHFALEIENRPVFDCPTEWHELTPAQFIRIVELQLSTPLNPTDKEQEIYFYGLLRLFFPIEKELFYDLPVDAIYAEYFHHAIKFLDEPVSNKSLLPVLIIDKAEYQGPGDGFTNVKLEQMAGIEVLMEAYADDANEEYLNQMVAVMYFPYKPGENEIPDEDLKSFAALVATLPYATRFAAYLNYRALRHIVPNRCSHLFGGTGSSSKSTTEHWEDLYSTLATNGPQDEPLVKGSPAITAMRWLNNKLEQQKTK